MKPGTGEKFDHLLKGMRSRVESMESGKNTEDSIVESMDSRVKTEVSNVESIDYGALEKAIDEAGKKPKLGVYSPIAAAVLRYKAITIPRYSMGSELREVVEQALKESYPELYEAAETALAELK